MLLALYKEIIIINIIIFIIINDTIFLMSDRQKSKSFSQFYSRKSEKPYVIIYFHTGKFFFV